MEKRKQVLSFLTVFVVTMSIVVFGFKRGDTSSDALLQSAAIAVMVAALASVLVKRRQTR